MSINNRGNSPEVHNGVVRENTHSHKTHARITLHMHSSEFSDRTEL